MVHPHNIKIYILTINTVEYYHYILILDKSEYRRKSSWGADLTISATYIQKSVIKPLRAKYKHNLEVMTVFYP